MADSKTQLALREWRKEMSTPVTWVALLGVGAVLSLVGPFDTDRHLDLVQRVVYWIAVVSATYAIGSLLNGLIRHWLEGRPLVFIALVAGVATGIAVSVIIFLANWVTFQYVPRPSEWLPFFGTIFAISMIVNGVMFYVASHLIAPAPAPQTKAPSPAPLLSRLPLEKRAALVSLSVEDHYVRVRTAKGEEMVLMRLSDAVREVGETPGAQVHRSHWVAFDAVTAASREGDRVILSMTHGPDIPVSRANISVIKEAGLLPR